MRFLVFIKLVSLCAGHIDAHAISDIVFHIGGFKSGIRRTGRVVPGWSSSQLVSRSPGPNKIDIVGET